MEIVVKRGYGKVVDADMYPIHLIKNNYEKVLEVIEKDGNRYEKIIWFLLNSYEEVLRNLKKEDNLRQILNKKSGDGQTIKKYRADKLIKQNITNLTNLYTYKKAERKTPDKLSKTPTKNKSEKTPLK